MQRAADGKSFEAVGNVPGRGTTTERQEYTFTDPAPLFSAMFYRLRQVDHDGTEAYSDVIRLRLPSEADRQPLRVYPNPPTGDVVYLNKVTDVVVTNMLGHVVYRATSVSEINIRAWPAGVYQVFDGFCQSTKIVVY